MSAPADVSAPASTPAPSAPASSTPSAPSAPAASTPARVDPHTSWEEFRARKAGSAPAEPVDTTPKLTPDKLQKWLDEKRAAEAADADPEQGDAKAQTAKATDDVQKIAAEATAKTEPDPEKPAAKGPREFKVKVKGEEIPVSLEKFAGLVKLKPETVEYIAEHEGEQAAAQLYQRLHRGDEAARQHGTLTKEVERAFSGLKSNTLDALDYLASRPDTGFDLLDAAYQIVQRDIDVKAMTPEGRRLREVEKQLRTMEAREKADTAERERVLREAHEAAERSRRETFAAEFGDEMSQALARAGYPADSAFHRRLVEVELDGDMARRGAEYRPPVGREQMRAWIDPHVARVREQLRAAAKAEYANADPETVKEFIADNPALHEAAAKARVAAFKKNSAAQANGNGADNTRGEKPVAGAPKNKEQWLTDLRRRA